MDRRPIPQKVRAWLTEEMRAWLARGILSEDESDQILAVYETQAEATRRRNATAVLALCGVAALMVGLAVLLMVSYNWREMSAAIKLTILFGSLLGSFAAGMGLRYAKQWRLTSEVVLFLSGILYGASIWLIAQIFNIQAHYPNGFLFWAIGVLPLAMCLDTVLLHALYAVLLASWVGSEILGFPAYQPLFFGRGPLVPNGAYALPLLALPGLLWAYRKRSLAAVALYVPLLAWWVVLQPTAWHNYRMCVLFVGMVGALLLLIAEAHRRGNRLAMPYRVWGILVTGSVLIPLSYADFLVEMLRYPVRSDASRALGETFWEGLVPAGVVLGVVGIVATLVVFGRWRRDAVRSGAPVSVGTCVRRAWMPVGLMVLFVGLCGWVGVFQVPHEYRPSYGSGNLAFWSPEILGIMLLVNAMMIVFAVWLMRRGLHGDSGLMFVVGVLYFLLWSLLRYGDLFAEIGGMLGAAMMFLLCGVGLFGCARYWHRHKEAIAAEDIAAAATEAAMRSPEWWERFSFGLKRREALWLVVGIAVQVAVLGGMIAGRMAILRSGETVLLRVAPVDPRDPFRGDYVILGYDFSSIPEEGIPGIGKLAHEDRTAWLGRTVYIELLPEEDGKHYRAGAFGLTRPKEGKFIRGEISSWRQVRCGIEAYYVQEGTGAEYETAARDRRLTAEVALTPDGEAALCGLTIESQ